MGTDMNKKAFLKGYLEKMAQATNTPQTVDTLLTRPERNPYDESQSIDPPGAGPGAAKSTLRRLGPSPGKEPGGPLVPVGKPQGGAQAVERLYTDQTSRFAKLVEQAMRGGAAKNLGKMAPGNSSKNAPVMRVQSGK